MGRIIIWLLLIFAALLVWRLVGYGARRNQAQIKRKQQAVVGTETMHACKLCGVLSPRSACIEQQGQLFCSIEHRDTWIRQQVQP